ncbi:hypothetical protein ACIOUE_35475 [Streptomyces xanthochromogenes]|uniref:hypothetical protein n=1 Tax=Streptomyces TaxID=1883 RepID=UPI0013710D27|nr:hypothetical protein [Streptomyces sp. SID1034]MYV92910.1 hypothetical protein [Streptomyces sp. SID1034]
MSTATSVEDETELVGRCYTKARRAPLVYGVIRDVRGGQGIRLPGGPYTLTQLASIIVTVGLLLLSRPVWGGHGWVDVVVLVALPFAVSFGLRQLHIDGRNPAAAMASVVMMLAGPRSGRLHGRPYRRMRPPRLAALVTLGQPDAPGASLAATGRDQPTVGPRKAPVGNRPAPPAAKTSPQTPASTPVSSGVQALLAARHSTLGD